MPTIKKVRKPQRRRAKKVDSQSAWPSDNDLKICIYGQSGTGKTTLWATFPGPILALICSGGQKPGELRSIDTPEYRKKITARILESPEEVEELIEGADEKYKTVVLDHSAGLMGLVIQKVMRLDETPAVLYRRAGKGEAWGIVPQKEWGAVNIQTIQILRMLLSLNCNVVIVAQEKLFAVDDDHGLILPHIGPDLTPGISKWFRPAVDYLCQTSIRGKTVITTKKVAGRSVRQRKRVEGQVEYCLRTAPHEVFKTKFRLVKGTELPEVIVDPTFAKIQALINQGGK